MRDVRGCRLLHRDDYPSIVGRFTLGPNIIEKVKYTREIVVARRQISNFCGVQNGRSVVAKRVSRYISNT